jgi:exodeoxyribonuclease VII small subunit
MGNRKDEAASPSADAGVIQKDARSPALAHGAAEVAKFEQALAELEQIVAKLERGELKLEESLKLFERGVALSKQCRKSLDGAELKVKHLLGESAGANPSEDPAA